MRDPDVIIIGAGQAGLAMSRSLTARGVDHVVLERGRIGERWISQRWDSLRLLTIKSMSALPGLPHGGDPEEFMPASAFANYLASYAHRTKAPVISGVEVICVEPRHPGYRVTTSAGRWLTRAVVIATGACDTPFKPACALTLSPAIAQIFPASYRNPEQLPDGGVLIVGASSSGVQLAEEIHASGRPVTLATGDHARAPRRYRGRDIYAWLDAAGILDQPPPMNADPDRTRRQPSLQVVGRADHREINLDILRRRGVRVVGRLAAIHGTRIKIEGDLQRSVEASYQRLTRMLDRIDNCIDRNGIDAPEADPAARAPIQIKGGALTLDLEKEGIRSVVWATGYSRRYPWLKARVLDERGEIIHRGGRTTSAGLYVLGLNFMRRRRSAFIDGCGMDAEDLAPLVRDHLDLSARQAA